MQRLGSYLSELAPSSAKAASIQSRMSALRERMHQENAPERDKKKAEVKVKMEKRRKKVERGAAECTGYIIIWFLLFWFCFSVQADDFVNITEKQSLLFIHQLSVFYFFYSLCMLRANQSL